MRILQAVPGSVLWLLEDNASAAKNLRMEASQRGISPERLIFAQRMTLPEHLARHRLADVFIDTFPCNAHTTASDALWAGLPVVTLMGNAFAGRVAASLLRAVGLPELVTTNAQDYEALLLALGNNPEKLKEFKRRLQENRLGSPLFDTSNYCFHLENTYEEMFRRYINKEPAETIEI
jgi:predicted O-linked N-acetylglucosamine transferase (SPINDLY family)